MVFECRVVSQRSVSMEVSRKACHFFLAAFKYRTTPPKVCPVQLPSVRDPKHHYQLTYAALDDHLSSLEESFRLLRRTYIATIRAKQNEQQQSAGCPTIMATDTVHHVESSSELKDLFSNTTYVVVDFFADWCPPCKAIAPIFTQLASSHGVPEQLAFAKVNVDHVKDVALEYGISAMPTFMFFKEGKQVMVNGQKVIRGADPKSLGAAAEKLGGLAKKRVEATAGAA